MFVRLNKVWGSGEALRIGKMSDLALIIGVGMVVVGLGLGIYIIVRIVEQRKADRDESFD